MKRGQEEMIGFAVIMIVVAVVLLVFLAIFLGNKKESSIESYEVSSFLGASLSYTSDCLESGGFMTVEDLILACDSFESCQDGRDTCDVLEETLLEISENSWGVKNSVVGWDLEIEARGNEMLKIEQGNRTRTYQSSIETIGRNADVHVVFNAYF